MYFVYNANTREVIGFYNKRDVVNICERDTNVREIPSDHAANIMKAQIWETAPDFFKIMCEGNAENVYKHYIRRSNLRRN